ncbi:MAG: magnesium/cobalt transporter CorA [Planctomycetes bacterium]|nr:magnesium/cobalt transporter CorA [Planctomycetota bacterium]
MHDPLSDSIPHQRIPQPVSSLNLGLPGREPGIETHELAKLAATEKAGITCIDYAPHDVREQHITANVDEFLSRHRPEWTAVRWINVNGVTDPTVIRALAEKYELHPLAVEDVMHVVQRPKVEGYPSTDEQHPRLFVIARLLRCVDNELHSEQVSLFLGRSTLLTFMESPSQVWEPIRQRLATAGSRLRQNDASFLLYALLDRLVDEMFPILDFYSDRLEELEEAVLEKPSQETIHQVHLIKRELLTLRRTAWPMREAIGMLEREPHECISPTSRTYLRDVYDHLVQIIDLVETYREYAASLAETYLGSISLRMNEVMKVLTIMGTIFIPLSFITGVYGMNMAIPELAFPYMYGVFWAIVIATVVGMVIWFRRRGWLD